MGILSYQNNSYNIGSAYAPDADNTWTSLRHIYYGRQHVWTFELQKQYGYFMFYNTTGSSKNNAFAIADFSRVGFPSSDGSGYFNVTTNNSKAVTYQYEDYYGRPRDYTRYYATNAKRNCLLLSNTPYMANFSTGNGISLNSIDYFIGSRDDSGSITLTRSTPYNREEVEHMFSELTSLAHFFENMYRLTGSPICGENVTSMLNAYRNCANLTGDAVCGSNVKSMTNAYLWCNRLRGNMPCGPNVTGMYQAYKLCGSAYSYAPSESYGCIGESVVNCLEAYRDSAVMSVEYKGSPDNSALCFYNARWLTDITGTINGSNAHGLAMICRNLQNVGNIGSGVRSLTQAFSGCYNLTKIGTISYGVENMNGAFYFCNNLNQEITIPDSVTNIDHCFSYCQNLSIPPTLPSRIDSLASCFSGCSSLETPPKIPEGVYNMYDTFTSCYNLHGRMDLPVIYGHSSDLVDFIDMFAYGRNSKHPALHIYCNGGDWYNYYSTSYRFEGKYNYQTGAMEDVGYNSALNIYFNR